MIIENKILEINLIENYIHIGRQTTNYCVHDYDKNRTRADMIGSTRTALLQK